MSDRHSTLPSLAIRRPIGTLSLAAVVIVLGVFIGRRLPIDLLPQIVYPQVRVNVQYPGLPWTR